MKQVCLGSRLYGGEFCFVILYRELHDTLLQFAGPSDTAITRQHRFIKQSMSSVLESR